MVFFEVLMRLWIVAGWMLAACAAQAECPPRPADVRLQATPVEDCLGKDFYSGAPAKLPSPAPGAPQLRLPPISEPAFAFTIRVSKDICKRKVKTPLEQVYCDDPVQDDDDDVVALGNEAGIQKVCSEIPGHPDYDQFCRIRKKGPPLSDLAYDTVFLSGLLVMQMGIMLQMDPKMLKWDGNKAKEPAWKMVEQNCGRRPVWDKDPWPTNFLQHPWAGAQYYLLARQRGYSRGGALIYAALVSAVLWECLIEGRMERTSIQDLIVTPLLGAVLGEVTYYLLQRIEREGGTLLGSEVLAWTVKLVLAPVILIIGEAEHLLAPAVLRYQPQLMITLGPDRFRTTVGEEMSGREQNVGRQLFIGLKLHVPPCAGIDRVFGICQPNQPR